MPKYDITGPDGKTFEINAPDGATEAEVLAYAQKNFKMAAAPAAPVKERTIGEKIGQGIGNIVAGGVRGAGSIGATLMYPVDKAQDMYHGDRAPTVEGLISGKQQLSRNEERRKAMDTGLGHMGAETDSFLYGAGKLGGEIAGTAGMGGLLGQGLVRAAPVLGMSTPVAANLANAVATGGFRAGTTTGLANAGTRVLGGAINGGVSAGMVNPADIGLGAGIGAALPGAAKVLGAAGRKIGSTLSGGGIKPEVKVLAERAAQLGIDVPADRIANSKPLNAVAAGLRYVPLSGRTATEDAMQSQLNTALSRTFGQNSDNVTMALRKAQSELGGEFDRVLQNNTVRVDSRFLDELVEHEQTAMRELGSDQANIISRQIDEIMSKGESGEINGQAAYNIKRILDRIGKRNSPEGHYATELRKSLMGALDRSLSPEASAAFATTRKQYGNMLTLEKIAQNGADGDVSIARLANMKNIGNKDLQELADISAQFLKPRMSEHGAAQRAAAGLGIGTFAGFPALAGSVAGARGTNAALNSKTARNMLLRTGPAPQAPEWFELGYKAAPVIGSD